MPGLWLRRNLPPVPMRYRGWSRGSKGACVIMYLYERVKRSQKKIKIYMWCFDFVESTCATPLLFCSHLFPSNTRGCQVLSNRHMHPFSTCHSSAYSVVCLLAGVRKTCCCQILYFLLCFLFCARTITALPPLLNYHASLNRHAKREHWRFLDGYFGVLAWYV